MMNKYFLEDEKRIKQILKRQKAIAASLLDSFEKMEPEAWYERVRIALDGYYDAPDKLMYTIVVEVAEFGVYVTKVVPKPGTLLSLLDEAGLDVLSGTFQPLPGWAFQYDSENPLGNFEISEDPKIAFSHLDEPNLAQHKGPEPLPMIPGHADNILSQKIWPLEIFNNIVVDGEGGHRDENDFWNGAEPPVDDSGSEALGVETD
jgi:hypothetical protein